MTTKTQQAAQGADDKKAAQPKLVEMPKAAAEIHYGSGYVEGHDGRQVAVVKTIDAGTVITDALAADAKLDGETIGKLEAAGLVTFVEVYMA